MPTRSALIAAAVAAGMAGGAAAQQGDAPDLRFLEYLGSWDESDEDWLIVAGIEGQDEESDDGADEPAGDDVAAGGAEEAGDVSDGQVDSDDDEVVGEKTVDANRDNAEDGADAD